MHFPVCKSIQAVKVLTQSICFYAKLKENVTISKLPHLPNSKKLVLLKIVLF